jgi:hypothetical protein
MAKKSADEVNKSQAIMDYLKNARRAKPATVVAALAEKGIEVTPQYVSSIRSAKRAKKKGKRGGQNGAATASASDKVSLGVLVQAKRLADQLGGVSKAKEALDALAKLQS